MNTFKLICAMLFLCLFCFNAAAENKETEKFIADGVVNDNDLRLRNQPGLSGKVIGLLHKGDHVKILERGKRPEQIGNMTSYWYYVDLGKEKGYCYGYFLDVRHSADSPYRAPGLIKDISVSSYTNSNSRRDGHPQMAMVSNGLLGWIPEGDGIGAYYEMVMDTPAKIKGLEIFSSYNDDRYHDYNRIKKMKIVVDGRTYFFDLNDNREVQELSLGKEQTFTRMKLIILEVYRGKKSNILPVSLIRWNHAENNYWVGNNVWCKTVDNLFSDPAGLIIHHGTAMPSGRDVYFFPDGTFVEQGGGGGGQYRYIGTWKQDRFIRKYTIVIDCCFLTASDGNSMEKKKDYYTETVYDIDSLFPKFFGENDCEKYDIDFITTKDEKAKVRSIDWYIPQ